MFAAAAEQPEPEPEPEPENIEDADDDDPLFGDSELTAEDLDASSGSSDEAEAEAEAGGERALKPAPPAFGSHCARSGQKVILVTTMAQGRQPQHVAMLREIVRRQPDWELALPAQDGAQMLGRADVVWNMSRHDVAWSATLEALRGAGCLRPEQWISSCVGLRVLCRKDRFERLLRRERAASAASAAALSSPETLLLPEEEDGLDGLEEEGAFIAKPHDGSQGSSIRLLWGRNAAKRWWAEHRASAAEPEDLCYVLQRYLLRPLTIAARKFDLRLYVAIVVRPGAWRCFLYTDGLIRLCAVPYSASREADADADAWRFRHLTNTSLNSTAADGAAAECSETMGSSAAFAEALGASRAGLWGSLAELAAATMRAVQSGWEEETECGDEIGCGMFQIVGLDVMLDEAARPWLLEVNARPSLTGKQHELKHGVVQALLSLLLDEGGADGSARGMADAERDAERGIGSHELIRL